MPSDPDPENDRPRSELRRQERRLAAEIDRLWNDLRTESDTVDDDDSTDTDRGDDTESTAVIDGVVEPLPTGASQSDVEEAVESIEHTPERNSDDEDFSV